MNIIFEPNWVQLLTLLTATVLPLLTALITTTLTASWKRAVILAALSAATGLLSELLDATTAGTAYSLDQGLQTALTSFLVAVGLYFGLWRSTVAPALQRTLIVAKTGPDGISSVTSLDSPTSSIAEANGRHESDAPAN